MANFCERITCVLTRKKRVKNVSGRGIAAMSFEMSAPHGAVINRWDNAIVNANPGDERTIYYPNNGDLIELYSGYTSVSITLTKIRYSDGELADYQCKLGSSVVPAPFNPVKPLSPSKIYPIGGEISPPRILESHAIDTRQVPHLCTRQEISDDPQVVCCQPTSFNSCNVRRLAVNLAVVIETDGSPQDITIKSGTLGDKFNQKAIETLHQWNFAPAMMGDTPVATKVVIPFAIDWYGR